MTNFKNFFLGSGHDREVRETLRMRGTRAAPPAQTNRSDWHLLVQGRRITEPQEFLLIHSMPNPYSPTPERLVVIGGRHGHGTQAIDIVLRDARLLEGLLRKTSDLPAWQALIPVTVGSHGPTAVGEYRVFEVVYDVERLNQTLANRPFLTNADSLGLMSVLPSTDRLAMQPKVVSRSFNASEDTLAGGTAQSGLARGPLDAIPQTADSRMKSSEKAKDLDVLPAWVRDRLSPSNAAPITGRRRQLAGITTIQTPDFNQTPLNGEQPRDIKKRFGVDVRVLRTSGPVTGSHSVWVSGKDDQVQTYLDHLLSTWRKSA